MRRADITGNIEVGVTRAATILASLAIAALFLGGVTYLFFSNEHSKIVGFIFLIFSTVVMIITIDQWVKPLAGILGLAILNGLFMLTTGHLLDRSSVRISRVDNLILLVYCVLACSFVMALAKRRLATPDRAAVMAFAFSFALLLGHGSTRITGTTTGPLRASDFGFMVSGLLCLFTAWIHYRLYGKSVRDERP